jgi:8-oxo-dGTP pyrophosphatase MutT (NUDIX family)
MTNNPWTTKSKQKIYENPWIRLDEHQVVNPSGNDGIYGVVHFKHIAIGIIPLDEHGNTWLVGQYRYAMQEYSWEIPEGGGSLHVHPPESSLRELKEETGMWAGQWTLLQKMTLSNSVTDETGLIYLARDLSFGEPEPTETEQLAVKKVKLDDAIQMVLDGEITDSLSVAGLLRMKVWAGDSR